MPPAKFDPLSNPRTSQVLFLLVKGVDTPTSLAETLKIKPPSVMEQLARLRKIHVVDVGEKTGKEQHYTIDWGKLAEETILHTVAPRYAPGVYRPKDAVEFVNKFPKFQVFLRSYFEDIFSLPDDHAKHFMKVYPNATVWKLLDDLHVTLISMMRDDGIFTEQLIDEPALRPFSQCLRHWVNDSQPQSPYAGRFLLATLTTLGFKARGEVTPEYQAEELILTPEEEARFIAIMLKESLVTRDEKTGMLDLTTAGWHFLKDFEKHEKALPAWLRNKQEAQLLVSRLSAITS